MNNSEYIEDKSCNINYSGIKKRYFFLFEGLDIKKWRVVNTQRLKIALDKKIKLEKAKIRKEKRIKKVRVLADELDEQIKEYLLKASPREMILKEC